MSFEYFKGELFENGRRYTKCDITIQKDLKKRIQNQILHVQFECKISVCQSNLMYPKYGVHVYNDLKQQKMPKRVKMLTSNTESTNTSSYILLDYFNAFWFVEKQFFLSQAPLPFWASKVIWLDQTGTLHI